MRELRVTKETLAKIRVASKSVVPALRAKMARRTERKRQWERFAGGFVATVGFLLVMGTAGRSDHEDLLIASGVTLERTPLWEFAARAFLGVLMMFAGISMLLPTPRHRAE